MRGHIRFKRTALSNLTDALYKQYMQQGIGMKERSAFYTGRRYILQMRYSF